MSEWPMRQGEHPRKSRPGRAASPKSLPRANAIDLRLPTLSGLDVRIVERPGNWMPRAEIDRLLAHLREVVSGCLEGDLAYGVLSGDMALLRRAVVTLLYESSTGRPVAFSAMTLLPIELFGRSTEVLHIGLGMINPAYRRRGLSWALYGLSCALVFIRRGLHPLWMSNVTQVPAVVGNFCEVCSTAYPNPIETVERTPAHLAVAHELMSRHRDVFGVGADARFDPERFVILNAYTGGSDNLKKSFDQSPKHRNDRVNELCQRQLDYARGDDFLQIARVDSAAVVHCLLRRAKRWALAGLAVLARAPAPAHGLAVAPRAVRSVPTVIPQRGGK